MSESSTSPARWQSVKRIFQEALDRDGEARAAFLESACGDDGVLRTEVQALLDADLTSSSPAGTAAFVAGIELAIDRVELDRRYSPGTRVGPYRILNEIGHGGMGVVYRAERADDAYRKEVAIKIVLRRRLNLRAIDDRFKHERQTLAGLDHPNIARIVDGGTTDDGCPYFVMDYIDGVPIDEYCDKQRLSVSGRLRLLLEVAAAVGFAHRNLVVHSDLKPDNILVSADGVPKLVDFGIATVLETTGSVLPGSDTEAPSNRTDHGAQGVPISGLMTPEYASPEQIQGKPITTATDIYSLGVVLYVLLSGRKPYDITSVESAQLERLICGTNPRPPSEVNAAPPGAERVPTAADLVPPEEIAARRRTSPRALRRRLSGDLDAIVKRAMQNHPSRRYDSVEHLSDDIRRHLDNLPVVARRDTVPYRMATFARRHRVGVGACAAGAILCLLGVTAIVRQARIASRERARAERRLNDVRHLANSFMFEIHDAIVNVPGTTAARTLMVRRALEYLDSLTPEAGGDSSLQRDLASAYVKVGDAQGNPTGANIGDTAGAKASYERAIAISRGLLEANTQDRDAQRTLAMAYRKQADVSSWEGDVSGGLARTRISLQLFTALAAAGQPDSEDRFQVAIGEIKLGDLLGNANFPNAGQSDQAIQAYLVALPLLTDLVRLRSDDERFGRYLGIVYERLGQMDESAGNLAQALAHYEKSFDIRARLAANHRYHADIQRDFAVAHEKIGNVLSAQGDIAGALARYRASLSMFEALASADRSNAHAARSVAISYQKMGDTLRRTPTPARALVMYRQAVRIHEGISSRDPANIQAQTDLAGLEETLGDTYLTVLATVPSRSKTETRVSACQAYNRSRALLTALLESSARSPSVLERRKRVESKVARCRGGVTRAGHS